MREKELRLGLVCYGGISLAIYMHGVCKEILKLARASADHRSGMAVGERCSNGDHPDTEVIYLDMLRQIGQKLTLHVVVDVIAGASAGGINSVLLARALAFDLAFDPLRKMWLEKADVSELIAADRKASTWSKWILRPFLQWGLSQRKIAHLAPDKEMQEKLSLFIRSRWFRPPFSGPDLCDTLYDGMVAMSNGNLANTTLMPTGQWLDLFVTLTDFFGYNQLIPLHDPNLVMEREHRHTLRFRHRFLTDKNLTTDFDLPDLPALVFAARATSSFPGAFPPARIAEVDQLVKRRRANWPNRKKFLKTNFSDYEEAGQDPQSTAFIDGSVLNNKPFAQAIEAIKQRPAYRQVDRRLVYIDPDPEKLDSTGSRQAPSMLRTLKGALSDIPRNEPIRDELAWVNGFNARVDQIKSVLDSTMPRIEKLVTEVIGGNPELLTSMNEMGDWRAAVGRMAEEKAGYAFDGYLQLRIDAVLEQLATILTQTDGKQSRSDVFDNWVARLKSWATGAGVYPQSNDESNVSQIVFLNGMDFEYRARRLRFVLRDLNSLYRIDPTNQTASALDNIKRQISDLLEELRLCRDAGVLSQQSKDLAAAITAEEQDDITNLINLLAKDFGLSDIAYRVDQVLKNVTSSDLPKSAQREILNSFLGFAFWDVLAFTVTSWRDIGEFEKIRVDRISPDDAKSLHHGGAEDILKGVGLGHFAAFFSRRHRENDYLWGRLHGAERVIDIVMSSAELENAAPDINVIDLKRRAFMSILESEAEHLELSGELMAELRKEVSRL